MSMFDGILPITGAASMLASPPPTDGIQGHPSRFNTGDFQLLTVQLEECNHQLGEHNKLLKKSCKKQKKGKRRKSFFDKVGDAFCKALPAILTTITTAVVSVLFKTPSSKKALHPACLR